MDYQGNQAPVEFQVSPCLVLFLDHMVHQDSQELPDSQALKGPVASLGLQANLDCVEIKETPEFQDWFTCLNCQGFLDLMGRRACLGFLGSLEKMACLGKLAAPAYQVPREPLVTSLVLKMVLRGSKVYRDCLGTEDFLETLAFQDSRVCLGSRACSAPKVSGAALEYQAAWVSQAPQALVVYLASRANPASADPQAFQAFQDILERKVQEAR